MISFKNYSTYSDHKLHTKVVSCISWLIQKMSNSIVNTNGLNYNRCTIDVNLMQFTVNLMMQFYAFLCNLMMQSKVVNCNYAYNKCMPLDMMHTKFVFFSLMNFCQPQLL